ncbi:hypothetical protein X975_09632, partial [Stegodyphus mimosarum]
MAEGKSRTDATRLLMLRSWCMQLNICRTLVLSSGLVCFDNSTESMMVGDVVNLSVISMTISVGITSLNIAVSIPMLLASLLEVTVMVAPYDVVSIFVGNGVMSVILLSIIRMATISSFLCTAVTAAISVIPILCSSYCCQHSHKSKLKHVDTKKFDG